MRTLIASTGLCSSLNGYCEAADGQPSIRKEIHIPAEDLSTALFTLGEDRHIQFIFIAEDVRGAHTRGASGSLTLEQALDRILAGTGLTYHYFDPTTITIIPAQGLSRAQGLARNSDASASHRPDPAPPAKPTTLDEVVVTARKRQEGLQDVPISVGVISGATLEEMGATQLSDYAGYVPGLTVVQGPTSGQDMLILRGISFPTPTALVGTYIDNSPVGASYPQVSSVRRALDLQPYDIERVEVLEGPQGTLYGANTMGGLLKYVMHRPELDVTTVRVGADFKENTTASAAGWSGHGSLNLPIVSGQSALRASFSQDLTPGFVDQPYQHRTNGNELRNESGRIAFAERLSDAWSVELNALTQDQYSPGGAEITLTSNFAPDAGRLSSSYTVPNTFKSSLRYYSADIDGDLGWASAKSATSYSLMRSAEWLQAYYPYNLVTGRGNLGILLALKKLTQEFRLTSATDQDLEWLLGIFYTNEQGNETATSLALDTSNRVIADAQLNPQVTSTLPSRYQEYALFGDATWKLARAFDLTLGLRESRNEQVFASITTCGPSYLNTIQAICPPVSAGTSSQDVFNFAVSSRYYISPGLMAYLRVASGYRPGAPSYQIPGIPRLKADTSINTEVGVKSTWLDHRVQFNAALYQIDWMHLQFPAEAPPPVNAAYIANGNAATVRGVEALGVVAPLSGLSLRLNVSYAHAVLSEPMPENSTLVGNRGDRLPFAPLWSGSLTAEYTHALHHGWQGKLDAGWQYVGQRYTTLNNPANCPQNCDGASSVPSLRPYGTLDVHASLSNGSWSVRFSGRNITNKYAIVDMEVGGGPAYDPWPILATLLSGRLVTVGVERRF